MSSLLLSDLHLPAEASPLRDAFAGFLEGPARKAQEIYILGDLFEYWIGDDAGLRIYEREAGLLKNLTAASVPVRFMHGNRDFLVGKTFAKASGVDLLPDPSVVNLQGVPTLLSHGDLLCTDDVGYQRWRRFSRNPLAQWLYARLPLSRREKIAGGVRAQSAGQKRMKAEDIMDVNAEAVRNTFERYNVKRMIHGHTHRPGEDLLKVGSQVCQRIVLADWRPERMEYLSIDGDAVSRIAL